MNYKTKMAFPNGIATKEVLITHLSNRFPNAKVKYAFKGFIDITQEGVFSSIDISKDQLQITVKSGLNLYHGKLIQLQTVIMSLILIPSLVLDLEIGGRFGTPIVIILAVIIPILWFNYQLRDKIKTFNHEVVAFLEGYQS